MNRLFVRDHQRKDPPRKGMLTQALGYSTLGVLEPCDTSIKANNGPILRNVLTSFPEIPLWFILLLQTRSTHFSGRPLN